MEVIAVHDKTLQNILEQARFRVQEMAVDEAYRFFKLGGNTTFVDIREPEELSLGYIKGSVFIRGDELEMQAKHLLPDRKAPVVLYCGSGVRSLLTAQTLKEMGYHDVRTLAGGINAWKEAGYEVVTSDLLTLDQLNHYSRQVILREVGIEGQRKLIDAKVLLVGAGGLGSPAAMYLAASGVGTLGIVDFDRVDKTNLNRQILHDYGDVGQPKVESAQRTLNRLNPEVEVVSFKERLSPQNALAIIREFDIILDGSDNFPTKYLLNDASFFAGKPYIFGAAVQFHGQASVFYPKGGSPCLRCMMPSPPREDLVPT
ncbi:MAG: ThiF family adenylyltransferase [Deltaproteobacteria bacterium]|jgi:molybdopterin/thiamine biosynthesis adenylyltransferase/rhodanese-related sulfurtransferase